MNHDPIERRSRDTRPQPARRNAAPCKAALLFLALAAAAPTTPAATRNLVWANRGDDMCAATNWNDASTGAAPLSAPTSEDRLFFSGRPGVQPRLSASLSVLAVRFGPAATQAGAAGTDDPLDHSGWTISGAEGARLEMPGSWKEGKNWNFAFSHSSFGTNTVNVPVAFTSTKTGTSAYRPILAFGGRLVFRRPISSATADAVLLVGGNPQNGTVALEAASPAMPSEVRLDAGVTLAVSSAEALGPVATLVLNQSGGSSQHQALRNASGGALALPGVTRVTSTAKNDGCHFEGDGPIALPNALFDPRLNDTREYYVDVPLSVRSIGNGYTGAGAFVFRKLGPAALRVAEDVFAGAPEGQTNRLDVVDGALVLADPAYLARERTLFGMSGPFFKNGARPALGLSADLAVAAGDAPGAFACYNDQTCAMGLAAFGGDRTATFYGGGAYQMGADAATVVSHGFSSHGFKRQATTLVFGHAEADGAATMANDLDLNQAQTHSSVNFRDLYAVRGAGPLAGRVAGRVYNSAGGGNASCRLRKLGDGALALDGACELASGDGSLILEGGLLANAAFAGPVSVTNGWLGGTGTMEGTVTVRGGGGALRPGDELRRGTLTLAGALALRDGARVEIAVGPDSNTALRFTGAGADCRAEGRVTLRLDALEGLEGGRAVKIFDWSEAPGASFLTMADPARYDFELPEGSPIVNPRLEPTEDAVWLRFSVDRGAPFKILFL